MAENFDPNLPPPPQQPVVNPYGFIMNPQQPQKKAPFGSSGSNLQKILFASGGAAVLLIIGILVFNLLFSSPGSSEQLIKVAQQQQEIVRMNTYATRLANQDMKNVAATTSATFLSEQAQYTAFLAESNLKIDQKKLAAGLKSSNTVLLESAVSTNTLDNTYKDILITELTTYQADLDAAYKAVSKQESKDLLLKMYTSAGLILADITETAPTNAEEVIRQ